MASHELRAQIFEVEQRISWLQEQLGDLYSRKQQLLARLENIIYPVLTLPDDITSTIFLYSASDPVESESQDFIDAMKFTPLQLAAVCAQWRVIAHATCALWNTPRLDYDTTANPAKLLEVWLSRAGELPLDLTVIFALADAKLSSSLFLMLAKYAPRYRKIRVISKGSPILVPVEAVAIPGPLMMLESVDIQIHSIIDNVDFSVILPREAPRLRIIRAYSPSDAVSMRLTLHRLVVLRLTTASDGELLALLPLTPLLESLGVLNATLGGPAPRAVELRYLHSLTLGGLGRHQILFDHLTMPALSSLELQRLSLESTQSLPTCIRRSCCTLASLKLLHCRSDAAFACFHSIPTLRHLVLVSPDWSQDEFDDWCGRLAETAPTGWLPGLESLRLEDLHHSVGLWEFVDMIERRWSGVDGASKIGEVEIKFQDDGLGDNYRRLRQLEEKGLRLHLSENQ